MRKNSSPNLRTHRRLPLRSDPAPLRPLSGIFYRIAFADRVDAVLDGAIHPEGRFHHGGQPALYASPTPQTAAVAIDIYLRPNDPPRVMVPLSIRGANMADLRDHETCDQLGIRPDWPSVPWADQRAAGQPATSWKASDAVRQSGADGMIYASRREPQRWHVVLFRWNRSDAGSVALAGKPTPWQPRSLDKGPT